MRLQARPFLRALNFYFRDGHTELNIWFFYPLADKSANSSWNRGLLEASILIEAEINLIVRKEEKNWEKQSSELKKKKRERENKKQEKRAVWGHPVLQPTEVKHISIPEGMVAFKTSLKL